MITEKENRLIDFVRLYLVDFINAESDDSLIGSFERIAFNGIKFLTDGRLDYSFTEKKDLINPDSDSDLNTIEYIQSILLKMLRIALIDDEFKKLYPEVKNITLDQTELEKYLHDLFAKEGHTDFYRWRGKGQTYILPRFFTGEDFYSECEYMIITVFYELFESQSFFEHGTVDAIGYQYFSFCPKCGKFFYKKRKDQVYCSEICRNNSSQDRHRKRIK